MRRRCHAIPILIAVFCAAVCGKAWGAEGPVRLPRDLAECLSAAQNDLAAGRTQAALERLAGYKGEDHALRHLLLGHAYVRQADWAEAARAYQDALDMDGALREAGIGLAQVRARQEQWGEAAKLLGRFAPLDSCEADLLLLYAEAALRLTDHRLCGLLVQKGIMRFPADVRFRRLDLAIAIDTADYAGARRAATCLLRETPADAGLWQQLAFAASQTTHDIEQIAALEAALLCAPSDLTRHRQFLAAQLAAGNWPTVMARGRVLLDGPLGKAASADLGLMELLISAADVGQQDDVLAAWLGRVPDEAHSRTLRLAAARLALRQGRTDAARHAFAHLIEAGETDPAVFLWAGHLAETAKDWPEAETLYQHARTLDGHAPRLATLYLARLHLRLERRAEAAQLLRQYLDTYPEDAAARALLALAEQTKE